MTLERWAINYGTREQICSVLDLSQVGIERALSIIESLPPEVRTLIHTIRSAESKIYGESILILCDEEAEPYLWSLDTEGGIWLGAVGLFAVSGFVHEY